MISYVILPKTMETDLFILLSIRFRLLHFAHNQLKQELGHLPLEGRRGKNCPHTEFFPSLLSFEGAFSGIVACLVQENFSRAKPTDPQISIFLLGDQYTKHCSSGKELEDQNLALWRNIHIHMCPQRKPCPPALGMRRHP